MRGLLPAAPNKAGLQGTLAAQKVFSASACLKGPTHHFSGTSQKLCCYKSRSSAARGDFAHAKSSPLKDNTMLNNRTPSKPTLPEVAARDADQLVVPQGMSFMGALVATVAKLEKRVYGHQRQLRQLQRVTYYPICVTHLLVLAANKCAQITGRGPPPTSCEAPPAWAKACINLSSVGLQEEDLNTIFITAPGSVRGGGNASVYEIPVEDQEAAVRSYPHPETRQRLARIFNFLHGHRVAGL